MATSHRIPNRVPRTGGPTVRAERSLGVSDRALRLILLTIVVAGGAALFALALLPSIGAAAGGLQRFSDEFQSIGNDIDIRFPKPAERSTIYADDGSVLATLYLDENRKVVDFENISDHMKQAVVAIEDERFYEHSGLDLRGIIRALVFNVRTGDIQQGASTLTQQLARNVFPEIGTEDTLARKIAEARVAMRIEDRYAKDQILGLYLNEVYFGRSVYGIGAAAEFYFGKPVGKLDLPESALLAGLIQAPERYSPVVNKDAARGRRNVVLDRMAELGYISEQEAAEAKDTKLTLAETNTVTKRRFPFFVEFVRQEIMDMDNRAFNKLGETRRQRERALFQGGLEIHTTLKPKLQRAGEKIARKHLPLPKDPENAMATVQTKSGAILALPSTARFKKSQVNLSTGQGGGGRQSGSAWKPFTLVAAFEKGIPPETVYNGNSGQIVDCTPFGPPNYRAVNAGGGGKMDLWAATQGSVNAVFVNLIMDAGVDRAVEVAHRMGIQSELPEVCSVTLGTGSVTPLEMASAFSTLANDGVRCRPHAVRIIKDRDGKELADQRKGRCKEVIDPKIAALTVNLLEGVVQGGTGTTANLGTWPVFGKTGSTNNLVDAWFVGCTRQLCTSSWVGHPENSRTPMSNVHGIRVFGGTFPAQIWHDYMMVAMDGRKAIGFPGVPKISWPKEKVPDVVGKRAAAAVDILGEAGFGAGVERVPSGKPKGEVIAQSPEGGAKATLGTAVSLQVSNGKSPKTKVPDVVSMTEGTAVKTLKKAGFGVAVSYRKTDQKNLDGIVKSQSPGGGSKAREGATVSITVYDYKKPKPSPSPSPSPPAG